jgi:hypothetical protein
MPAPDVVLFERSNDWRAGLRRMIQARRSARLQAGPLEARLRIHSVRTLEEALRLAHERPGGVLMLELTRNNAERVLDAVIALDRRRPDAKIVVVARRSEGGWERPARLTGVVHFASSVWQLAPVVESIERSGGRQAEEAGSIAQIWRRLPWRDFETRKTMAKAK